MGKKENKPTINIPDEYKCPLFLNRPFAYEYYDFEKNSNIDFRKLMPGSNKKIWWKCPECGYSFPRKIQQFEGACSVCSGKTIMTGINDAATKFPELKEQFIPEMNPEIKLEEEPWTSKKEVIWTCENGHEWPAKICNRINRKTKPYKVTECPECLKFRRKFAGCMELISSFDCATNHCTIYDIDNKDTYTWVCEKHGSFKARFELLKTYYMEYGVLPCCNDKETQNKIKDGGLKRIEYESLLEKYPDLVEEYSPDNPIGPESINYNSKKEVEWICRINPTHKWKDAVRDRTVRGYKCPHCKQENSFTVKFAYLEKNFSKKNGIEFKSLLGWSNVKYLWICDNRHEVVTSTELINQGGRLRCYTCDRTKYYDELKERMFDRYPGIENIWDDEKNREMFIKGENDDRIRYFHFKCKNGHKNIWDIRLIVNNGCNCPVCEGAKVLSGVNDLATIHPELSNEAYSICNYMIGTDLTKCIDNSRRWAYWNCPDCNHVYRMRICDRAEKEERKHRPCPRCNLQSKKKIFVF